MQTKPTNKAVEKQNRTLALKNEARMLDDRLFVLGLIQQEAIDRLNQIGILIMAIKAEK
jgi:hypothetical protein